MKAYNSEKACTANGCKVEIRQVRFKVKFLKSSLWVALVGISIAVGIGFEHWRIGRESRSILSVKLQRLERTRESEITAGFDLGAEIGWGLGTHGTSFENLKQAARDNRETWQFNREHYLPQTGSGFSTRASGPRD